MSEAQIWVLIIIGCVLAGIIAIVIFKRGGSITSKQLSIFIPESKKKPGTPFGNTLQYLYDAIPLIRQEYESAYLSEAKKSGIDETQLMANEDVKFFIQMAGNFVYSGNGINSVKTIFEQVLSSKTWLDTKEEQREYESMVIRRICQTVTKYCNQNYDDYVMCSTGELRKRVVDSIQMFKRFELLYRIQKTETEDRRDGPVAKIIIDVLENAIETAKRECNG